MANPFNVENASGTVVFNVDGSGNVQAAGAMAVAGVVAVGGTSTTTTGANILTPTIANGTAAQLSDLTRDYMVYMDITTSGTATTLGIGPTAAAANTLIASAAATAGVLWSFRLPAGWFIKWSGTTTALTTVAISC